MFLFYLDLKERLKNGILDMHAVGLSLINFI